MFRFSVAHEVGHAVLPDEPGASETQEREADEFASELLMPEADIRAVLRNTRPRVVIRCQDPATTFAGSNRLIERVKIPVSRLRRLVEDT